MNREEICTETIAAAMKAGKFIMELHVNKDEQQIEEKGKHDFVTNVDKNAELLLVEELSKILPEAGFITEEGTEIRKGEKYNWIIDPIDGTTNFIHGAFPFAVSIALAEDLVPVVGVILELGLNECFYAWKDGGAYLNGSPIKVSSNQTLYQSLIATGFPHSDYSRIEGFTKSIDWLLKNSHGMRRLGSAATDIAWVACGRFDGFYEYGLSTWDVAAGVVIVNEAGGKCSDFSGNVNDISGKEIIVSNGLNHNEFADVIRMFMLTND
ncbi:inositol monophosphatase family protein [Bacteroidota bacterium]